MIPPSEQIANLRPKYRPRLMDLVRDAGTDVTAWGKYAGGEARAASNPKYCYEWSFCVPEQTVVVSIWHDQLRLEGDRVVVTDSLRATAKFYAGVPEKAVWTKRAEAFDQSIALAAKTGTPVRVIICDGIRRAKFDLEARASKVKARLLDPEPWAVTSYNADSGDFTLTRGAPPNRLKDQFADDAPPASPTEVKSICGEVFVRNPAVRKWALTRAAGHCEWCGEVGFVTDDGSVFLETHHVVPLSEGGGDVVSNVVALCANHHREAHFGSARATMRAKLLESLAKLVAPAV